MEEQTEQQSSQRSRGLSWPIWALFFLPLIYVLSSGPMMALYSKGFISGFVIKALYTPLFWCAGQSVVFGKPFYWYLAFCGSVLPH